MKSSLLFDSFHQWVVILTAGLGSLFFGFTRIIYCIVFGFLSIIVWVWQRICRFVSKYPNIALGTFIVLIMLVWLFTFVSMRTRAVGAESQRDSISYEFHLFKKNYGYE